MKKNLLARKKDVDESVEQLEKLQKSSVFVEKKLPISLYYKKNVVWNKGSSVDEFAVRCEVDREPPKLFTEVSKENEGVLILLKKAKVFPVLWENILIFIIGHVKFRGYLGSGVHSKADVKVWIDLGGERCKFNMVDDVKLRALQRDTEKQQELIVRVTCYVYILWILAVRHKTMTILFTKII